MSEEILSRIVENFIDAKRATKGFDLKSATAIRETDLDGFYRALRLGNQDRRCDAEGSDRALVVMNFDTKPRLGIGGASDSFW